jgi:hypothetical protein
MEYKLQLVEEKVKQQQVTALHLITSLAFLGAGAIIFIYNYVITYWGLALLIVALVLLTLTIAKNKQVTTPANNTKLRIAELIISLALLSYSIMQQWRFPMGMFGVLSAVLAFSIFWERKTNAAQFVIVSEEGIDIPAGVRKKLLEWTGVEEVLWRYGTLSIDCTDNHLYQWNVQPASFDKDTFEAFCKKQVADNLEKRPKNDW